MTNCLVDYLKSMYTRRDDKILRPDGSIAAVLGKEPGTRIKWYAYALPQEVTDFVVLYGKGYS